MIIHVDRQQLLVLDEVQPSLLSHIRLESHTELEQNVGEVFIGEFYELERSKSVSLFFNFLSDVVSFLVGRECTVSGIIVVVPEFRPD